MTTSPSFSDTVSLERQLRALQAASANSDVFKSLSAQGDEIIQSIQRFDDTHCMVNFHRKYGTKPGMRRVMLEFRGVYLHVMQETFTAEPKKLSYAYKPSYGKRSPAHDPIYDPSPVLERYTKPVVGEIKPSDHVSQHMSFVYHVRSLGDLRVVCECRDLADAQRIQLALSNTAIYTYRPSDGSRYEDNNLWMVK